MKDWRLSVQRRFKITGWIDASLVEVTNHEDVVEERVRATGRRSEEYVCIVNAPDPVDFTTEA